jgi:putative ABC transport system permease protein
MGTFIKLTLRNILKNRISFLIVSVSLIIGFTVTLFLGIYIYNELRYDTFHENDNLYRVSFSGGFADKKTDYAFSWAPLGPKLNNYFPEIIDFTRLYRLSSSVLKYEENKFQQDGMFYADQNFFNFFSFELIKGNPESVLSEPNYAVITQEIAEKYFVDHDPIGKILEYNDMKFVITGVAKSAPIYSHIKFDILFSLATLNNDRIGPDKALESFRRVNFYTYLQLSNSKSIETINSTKQEFIDDQLFVLKRDLKVDIDLIFYPIEDIHLYSHLDRELEPNNSLTNLLIVSIIGIFVFIISCVNFVLITTNINLTRFKEVFLKKVVGQKKGLLVVVYILEILIICIICFLLALLVFYFFLPQYNILTNTSFSIDYIFKWEIITGIIITLLFVGIVPGYFSGRILFNFNPSSTRNNTPSLKTLNSTIILIIQFSIAFILVICSLVFNKQLNFIQNHELGYDKSNLLLIHINNHKARNSIESLCAEYAKLPEVKSVTASANHLANEPLTFAVNLSIQGEEQEVQTNYNKVDYYFKDCYDLRIVEGRYFSREFSTDSFGVVVNQTFCKEMNLVKPIGTKLSFLGREYHIIGVVKDFFFSSFKERIEPYVMFFSNRPQRNNYISLKLIDNYNNNTLFKLEKIWTEFATENFFEYNLYDHSLQIRYQNDLIIIKILKYLSLTVIIIALSGILGQSFLLLRLKRKEIAIRKVLGANYKNMLYILTKKYFLLLTFSWIIACIASYYLIDEWIKNFIFRFENQMLYYVVPCIISIIMLLILISIKTFKAIQNNPINALQEA